MVTKVPPALGPKSGLTLVRRSVIKELSCLSEGKTRFTDINRKMRSEVIE